MYSVVIQPLVERGRYFMKKGFVVCLSFLMTIVLLSPVQVKASNPDDVLAYINAEREAVGLDDLLVDSDLSDVAAVRAVECSTRFSHTRPNGKPWYTVSNTTNGENLAHAVNSNQQKPENVVLAWMLSPSHKANVLRDSFSSIGIAYYYDEDGETFIVCEFR
jgi:uncharacterized protein YkwD